MLYGNQIKLRYYESKDFDLVYKLRNIPESYDWFYEYEPINSTMMKNWWEQSYTKRDEKNFIIADMKTDEAIGTCSLVHIDYRNRKCEFGRFQISSEKNLLGSAIEAEILCLEYAFSHLNMHKIYLEVFEKNKSVISLHQQFGFEKEGMLKSHIYKNGKYENILFLALYNDIFSEKSKKIHMKLSKLKGIKNAK